MATEYETIVHAGSTLPLTDTELDLYAKGSGDERFIGNETILDGEGVPQDFIDKCRKIAGRLTGYPNILDYHIFPRDTEGPTFQFFQGEDFEHRTEPNEINNPLRLIRPLVLSSPSNMVYYDISPGTNSPRNYAQSASERDHQDNKKESLYARGVVAYEDLFITILETTNITSGADISYNVQAKLDEIFKERGLIKEGLKKETPAGWLTHAVLAVALHPSETITPAGRLRALKLLELYPTNELFSGFGCATPNSSWGSSFLGSGLRSSDIKARLPYTLCLPSERYLDEHKDWEKNPVLSPIVQSVKSGDYRSAVHEIVSRPQEAIQLTLLMLRLHGREEFAVGVLREIPNLDRHTLAIMFGPSATFYTDNSISNSLKSQVAEGAGTKFDPTLGFDGLSAEMLESASAKDLKRLFAAALLRLRTAEELAAKATSEKTGMPEVEEEQDPEGLWATLGLNPNALRDLSDDELKIIINGAARTMSKVRHSDPGAEEEYVERNARQTAVNLAREKLLDDGFRKTYGRNK